MAQSMSRVEGMKVSASEHRNQFLQLVFDFLTPPSHAQSSGSVAQKTPTKPKPQTKELDPTSKRQTLPKDSRTVQLQGQSIAYELLRRKRKTIGMQVSEGKLRVAAPKWVSLTQVQEALQEKSSWILKQIEHTREKAKAAKDRDVQVQHECVLPWLGAGLQVRLQTGSCAPELMRERTHLLGAAHVGTKTLAKLVEQSFLERQCESAEWVRCTEQEAFERESSLSHLQLQPGPGVAESSGPSLVPVLYRLNLPLKREASSELTLQVLTAVLKAQALVWFERRLNHMAECFGVTYKSFKLSAAQTRWGSASQSGVIHLNWHLVHFSPALIDYVVAHELCHLIHMNHSDQFWARLNQVMPDSERSRKILHRKTPPRLLSLEGSMATEHLWAAQ